MANHDNTKKSIRKTQRRQQTNIVRKNRIRTFISKVEQAIAGKDKNVAMDALKAAQSEMMSGVTKGLFKKNTVSRKISRLSKRIKAVS